MKVPNLRSPDEMIGGLVFFGRTLDKVRLHAQGRLPADYHANLGSGMDGRICRFLHVKYDQLVTRTLQGGTDEEILEWCFTNGQRPSNDMLEVFNGFLAKRGWRDEASEALTKFKKERGFGNREDIQTFFDFQKADEAE